MESSVWMEVAHSETFWEGSWADGDQPNKTKPIGHAVMLVRLSVDESPRAWIDGDVYSS